MDQGLDFSAVKYSGGGDEDILRLDQVKRSGEFDGTQLDMFNPIRAHEVFEIEISLDLDPIEVLRHLHFDNHDAPDTSDAEEYQYPVDWLDEYAFESTHRYVSRLAVLRQGGELWKIIGVKRGDSSQLALADPEDSYYPATRYLADRVLGDYSYHLEGPGPVSWDGSSALLDLGGFWIYANGGDVSEEDSVIRPEASTFGLAYLNWLHWNSAYITFMLNNVKCGWENQEQLSRFEQLLSEASEVNYFSTDLNEEEVGLVLNELLAWNLADKELINILRSPSHPLAPAIIKVLEEVVDTENAQALRWRDGLVAHLATL